MKLDLDLRIRSATILGMKIDPAEYVRIGTAAALAGVTRAYINRLIKAGRLPAVTIDGQNFVRRTDAVRFKPMPPGGKK